MGWAQVRARLMAAAVIILLGPWAPFVQGLALRERLAIWRRTR